MTRTHPAVLALLLATAALAAPATARAATPPAAPAAVLASPASDLGARVSAALSGSGASVVGASVDVGGLGQVLRRGSTRLMQPASTQKSFVVAAALLALPATTRQRTEVVSPEAPRAGRVRHLWLVAGGDPHLTDPQLRQLAADVRAKGVTRVDGDLLLDDRRYDQVRDAPGWQADYVPEELGPLSAMVLDRNEWRTDAAFVADPALPATDRFRSMLRARGVTVAGTVRRAPRPGGATLLARKETTVLAHQVRLVLKDSDNFAAELMLKELGFRVRAQGTTQGGITAVKDVLAARRVPFAFSTDGSGLSTRDRQTPDGENTLLRSLSSVSDFRAALPVACRDGTLERRMCGTAAAGRVLAKTGTLDDDRVRALSGYTTTASGRPVFFAFLLGGVGSGAQAVAALDRAAVVLASARE